MLVFVLSARAAQARKLGAGHVRGSRWRHATHSPTPYPNPTYGQPATLLLKCQK